ncbi:uncharacterized protein LOC112693901 [Sipha flava]|uniref:Uncharacterized protein LOC112693901 n=1 Tax=Sipha flava TaxID=143950 RepID=A0A8B8GQQ8_9HEMI|nr:uncharacterized protein LOC112693901 [Sipha flava]
MAKKEIVFRVRHTGVTRVALIKRTLDERYVLELDGHRATLSREGHGRWPAGRTVDAHQSEDTTAASGTGAWTRIHISYKFVYKSRFRSIHICGTDTGSSDNCVEHLCRLHYQRTSISVYKRFGSCSVQRNRIGLLVHRVITKMDCQR